MRCIQCGTDNKLQERTNNQGRCKKCNHQFVFEPRAGDTPSRLTDVLFAKALNELSANNTLYFTPKQLFYFLEKRFYSKGLTLGIKVENLVVFVCAGILIAIGSHLASVRLFVMGLIVLLISLIIPGKPRPKRSRNLSITQSQVGPWVNRWNQVNPPSEKLLPSLGSGSTARIQPTSIAGDVTVYSFDRLVVCDSVEVAQMLIANNFHFENNCAVLSISGYPERIFSTVMQMLRRNLDLQVFAFHNCSPNGIGILHQLRTDPAWFAESNAVIIDVGLLPRQIMTAKKDITIQNAKQSTQDLAPQIRQTLSEAELQWLDAGNWVDLESFTPKALIQILQRSIARSQTINETDSGLLSIEDETGRRGSIYITDGIGGFG